MQAELSKNLIHIVFWKLKKFSDTAFFCFISSLWRSWLKEWIKIHKASTFNTRHACPGKINMCYKKHCECDNQSGWKSSCHIHALSVSTFHSFWFFHHSKNSKCQRCISTTKSCINKELNKILMVIMSNTIADPWTMVIHLEYASVTQRTMMSSWRFYQLTFFAISVLYKFSPWKILILFRIEIFTTVFCLKCSVYSNSSIKIWVLVLTRLLNLNIIHFNLVTTFTGWNIWWWIISIQRRYFNIFCHISIHFWHYSLIY